MHRAHLGFLDFVMASQLCVAGTFFVQERKKDLSVLCETIGCCLATKLAWVSSSQRDNFGPFSAVVHLMFRASGVFLSHC